MDSSGSKKGGKGITIDIIEVALIAVTVFGVLCALALPGGFSLRSVEIGRYDLFLFSATALVVYRAVMRITR